MSESLGDFRVTFTVHGRCADAFIRRRADDWAAGHAKENSPTFEQCAAEFRRMVAAGEISVPLAPVSAAFDTRRRAEEYAALARSNGVTDVSISTSFKRYDPETGKFRVAHSVPPEIAAIAQSGSA